MSLIEIEDVRKVFGDHVVLDGVSLSVEEHEVVCLIGPSGCGKSTLLYLLGLLDQPDGGEIAIAPFDAVDVQPASVDLHLDGTFRVFRNNRYGFIDPRVEQPDLTEIERVADGEDVVGGLGPTLGLHGHTVTPGSARPSVAGTPGAASWSAARARTMSL